VVCLNPLLSEAVFSIFDRAGALEIWHVLILF